MGMATVLLAKNLLFCRFTTRSYHLTPKHHIFSKCSPISALDTKHTFTKRVLIPNIINRTANHSTDKNKNFQQAVNSAAAINTATSEQKDGHSTSDVRPNFLYLDTSFGNAEEAYKSKTMSELIRAMFVFRLTSIDMLVKHNMKVGCIHALLVFV